MNRASKIIAISSMIITAMIILGTRLLGPGDLYEKDQPKTIAYTADMVVNGRFALPRDVIYQPATKPPMYNWIDYAVLKSTGVFSEFTLKFPSLLGAIATAVIIFIFCRKISPGKSGWWLASVSVSIWFTFGSDMSHAGNGSVIRLAYLARPDMLQCAFLAGAWLFATLAVEKGKSFWIAMLFWICVACAALTKGPAAIIAIVFAILLAVIPKKDRWRRFRNLRFEIGLPLLLIMVGAWVYCAYQQNPQHVTGTMFGAELWGRVNDQSPEHIHKPVYMTITWFVTKTMPWGIVSLLGLVIWFAYRRLDPQMLPAALWMVVAIVMLSIPAGKRIDYLLPIYPAASVMAGFLMINFVIRRWRHLLFIIPIVLAWFIADAFVSKFHETKSHDTDRTVAFVNQVKKIVGTDSVIVINRGKHPVTTLLGRHQGSYLTADDLKNAKWVIIPQQGDLASQVVSEPIPTGFEVIGERARNPLALYHNDETGPGLEKLIELQKAAGEWKIEENPYHEPGTVWREESR